MRALVLTLALPVALIAAGPVAAQTSTIVAPVFAQLVTGPLPDGFVPAFEDGTQTGYLNESVPRGETVDDWSQMVTLTGAQGLALGDAPTDAAGFAEFLADSYHQACPESLSLASFDIAPLPGAQDSFAGYLGCGTLGTSAMSEQMVFVVMVGTEDIYTLQWAAHGPASAAPIEFPGGIWNDRLDILLDYASLCEIIEGEEPPYPSCTGS